MILQRYILRELAVAFALAFAAMIAVFAIAMALQTLRTAPSGALDLLVRLAPTAVAYASPWAVLVAATVATTLVFGRLAADNELDAVRTSGIHIARVLAPGLVFAVALCGVSWGIVQEILPRALFERRNLVRESAFAVLRHPPPGRQTLRVGDNVVLAYQDASDGRLRLPVVQILRDGRVQQEFRGREATIELAPGSPPALVVLDGQLTSLNDRGEQIEARLPAKFSQPLPLQPPSTAPDSVGDMTRRQLAEWMAPGGVGATDWKAWTEFWTRQGKALAPLALVLISMVLGIGVRKGSRLAGLGMALPPLLGYIVLMFVFESLGRRGHVPTMVAGLAPSGVLLATGTILAFRVSRQ